MELMSLWCRSKGFIFTMDALIGVSILVLTMVLLFQLHTTPSHTEQTRFFVRDTINTLASIKVSESNNPYVLDLMSAGLISNPNNTILEQIGEFWANGDQDLAKNLSKEFLDDILPDEYGYGMWIDDDMIYNNSVPEKSQRVIYQRVVSGIKKGRPKEGYLGRAWATKMQKNNTLIVKGDVITSSVRRWWGGNNGNKVNITYGMDIPAGATLIDSYWFIESAWTDNKIDAYINDVHVGSGTGGALFTNLNSYLRDGHNALTVVGSYGSGGNEAGDDGASHFVLNYSIEKMNTLENLERKYFAQVVSHCSIRYKKPIFVLGDINSLFVNMSIIATTAELRIAYRGTEYDVSQKNVVDNNVYWTDNEIKSALNSVGITYENLSNEYFWFVVDVDTYHSRENYGAERKIFNTSYVEIKFSTTKNLYGSIDLTKVVPIDSYSDSAGGSFSQFYRNLGWRFDSPGNATPLALDSQLAWLYYTGANPSQIASANSIVLYQHPPDPLIHEFARFGYVNKTGEIVAGTNTYNLTFGYGYYINPFNSLVDYTFLIPSQVGYGETFSTESDAKDDAINRLKTLLGPYVSATEIQTSASSVGRVPTLWGPSLVEVRIWRQ